MSLPERMVYGLNVVNGDATVEKLTRTTKADRSGTFLVQNMDTEDNADKARLRIISILKIILYTTNQTKKITFSTGFRHFDIYSACFIGLLKPMPPEKCPATDFRPAYSSPHTDIKLYQNGSSNIEICL